MSLRSLVWMACILFAVALSGEEEKPAAGLPTGFKAKGGAKTDRASGLPMEIICEKDASEMVLVPAGEFAMGSERGEADERPVHTVYLDAYYIGKYEVSNAQYLNFVKASGAAAPIHWSDVNLNHPDQPVLQVSRSAADDYCRWIGKRLPTEAEWEKAARGTDGREYPWGNEPPDAGGGYRCNFQTAEEEDSDEAPKDGFRYTAPVKSFENGVSPYGCYNMAGNVWEWCNDWYDPEYYARSPRDNPQGPQRMPYASHRGGSFSNRIGHMRSVYRSGFFHALPNPVIGIRCALSPVVENRPKRH